ncbi:unnamed protein product [Pedinophyceae sp. YPF-701]|nr:unnamed protein product [Pedinophyceae sp. YPF-701]
MADLRDPRPRHLRPAPLGKPQQWNDGGPDSPERLAPSPRPRARGPFETPDPAAPGARRARARPAQAAPADGGASGRSFTQRSRPPGTREGHRGGVVAQPPASADGFDWSEVDRQLDTVKEQYKSPAFDALPQILSIVNDFNPDRALDKVRGQQDRVEALIDAVVPRYRAGFTKAIHNYSDILRLFLSSQDELRSLRSTLDEAQRRLGAQASSLLTHWRRQTELSELMKLLEAVEALRGSPAKVEALTQKGALQEAVAVLLDACAKAARSELAGLPALAGVRAGLTDARGRIEGCLRTALEGHVWSDAPRGSRALAAQVLAEELDLEELAAGLVRARRSGAGEREGASLSLSEPPPPPAHAPAGSVENDLDQLLSCLAQLGALQDSVEWVRESAAEGVDTAVLRAVARTGGKAGLLARGFRPGASPLEGNVVVGMDAEAAWLAAQATGDVFTRALQAVQAVGRVCLRVGPMHVPALPQQIRDVMRPRAAEAGGATPAKASSVRKEGGGSGSRGGVPSAKELVSCLLLTWYEAHGACAAAVAALVGGEQLLGGSDKNAPQTSWMSWWWGSTGQQNATQGERKKSLGFSIDVELSGDAGAGRTASGGISDGRVAASGRGETKLSRRESIGVEIVAAVGAARGSPSLLPVVAQLVSDFAVDSWSAVEHCAATLGVDISGSRVNALLPAGCGSGGPSGGPLAALMRRAGEEIWLPYSAQAIRRHATARDAVRAVQPEGRVAAAGLPGGAERRPQASQAAASTLTAGAALQAPGQSVTAIAQEVATSITWWASRLPDLSERLVPVLEDAAARVLCTCHQAMSSAISPNSVAAHLAADASFTGLAAREPAARIITGTNSTAFHFTPLPRASCQDVSSAMAPFARDAASHQNQDDEVSAREVAKVTLNAWKRHRNTRAASFSGGSTALAAVSSSTSGLLPSEQSVEILAATVLSTEAAAAHFRTAGLRLAGGAGGGKQLSEALSNVLARMEALVGLCLRTLRAEGGLLAAVRVGRLLSRPLVARPREHRVVDEDVLGLLTSLKGFAQALEGGAGAAGEPASGTGAAVSYAVGLAGAAAGVLLVEGMAATTEATRAGVQRILWDIGALGSALQGMLLPMVSPDNANAALSAAERSTGSEGAAGSSDAWQRWAFESLEGVEHARRYWETLMKAVDEVARPAVVKSLLGKYTALELRRLFEVNVHERPVSAEAMARYCKLLGVPTPSEQS